MSNIVTPIKKAAEHTSQSEAYTQLNLTTSTTVEITREHQWLINTFFGLFKLPKCDSEIAVSDRKIDILTNYFIKVIDSEFVMGCRCFKGVNCAEHRASNRESHYKQTDVPKVIVDNRIKLEQKKHVELAQMIHEKTGIDCSIADPKLIPGKTVKRPAKGEVLEKYLFRVTIDLSQPGVMEKMRMAVFKAHATAAPVLAS